MPRFHVGRIGRGCVPALLFVSLASLALPASTFAAYRVLALTGQSAPGTSAEFVDFGTPVINPAGEVAFQSFLSGPTTEVVPHGVFVGSANAMQAAAVAGQAAGGGGGARFRTPGPPQVLTVDQQVLFYGNMLDEFGVTFENDYGIWAGNPTDVQLIARNGAGVPGLPLNTAYTQFFARPTSSGVMGLSASFDGPGVDATNNSAAWIGPMTPEGQLEMVARAGDSAPGLPEGWRFAGLGAPAVNVQRQFAVAAVARNESASSPFVPGIWGGEPGDLQLLASSLSPVPGVPDRTFNDLREPKLDRQGHYVFTGSLAAETEAEWLSDAGIWAGQIGEGGLQTVVREGDAAPEFGASAVFRGSAPGVEPFYRPFSDPVLGGSGRVAFVATVFGEGIDYEHNDGVWVSEATENGYERTLIAREGDQPPGTPEGTRFIGQDLWEDLLPAFERPLLTTSGQVAFEASTTGPWGAVERGIWATDGGGDLHLIAHTGNELRISPDDWRTISLIKLLAGGSSDDGYLAAINDMGQLAFSVSFTDGTEAVIVASIQPGDTDADGDVDLEDLNNVRNHFGAEGLGDTDNNGTVDLTDLNNVRNNFGESSVASAVPEPSALLILVAGAISLGLARRQPANEPAARRDRDR